MPEIGQVIATFSRRMRVRLEGGEHVDARIKGKRTQPVCGDFVTAQPIPGESDWLILDIRPRRNALTRPNRRGEPETLAANVDRLYAVAAVVPKPDWFVIDRYLGAAEIMGVGAVIIFNKDDLTDPDSSSNAAVESVAADYRRAGYEFIRCSAVTGSGMAELAATLAAGVGIFVGQSGVGKSSLINCLLDSDAQRIGDLSEKHREGRHTTVNSAMLRLAGGGAVIDSPGVRDFAPALDPNTEVASGFVEILAAGSRCKFANCQHMKEPACAVKAAVDAGQISERRYESYRRLVILTAQLAERRSR